MSVGLPSVLPFLLLLQPAPRPADKTPLPYRRVMVRTHLENDADVEKRPPQHENPSLAPNDGWHRVAVAFNTSGYDKVPFVWSDMFDPHHNAGTEKKWYYLTEGSFAGSWKTWLEKYELLGAFGDLVSGRK